MKTPLRVRQLPIVHVNRWYSIEEGLPFIELSPHTYGADFVWVTYMGSGGLTSYPVCQIRWRHKSCDATREMGNRLVELDMRKRAALGCGPLDKKGPRVRRAQPDLPPPAPQTALPVVPTPEEQKALDLLLFTFTIPRAYNIEPQVHAVEPGRDGGLKSIPIENIVGWIIPSCPEKLTAKWLSANPEEETT